MFQDGSGMISTKVLPGPQVSSFPRRIPSWEPSICGLEDQKQKLKRCKKQKKYQVKAYAIYIGIEFFMILQWAFVYSVLPKPVLSHQHFVLCEWCIWNKSYMNCGNEIKWHHPSFDFVLLRTISVEALLVNSSSQKKYQYLFLHKLGTCGPDVYHRRRPSKTNVVTTNSNSLSFFFY